MRFRPPTSPPLHWAGQWLLVLLALLLTGCPVHGPGPTGARRPDASQRPDRPPALTYTFRLQPGQAPSVRIELALAGAPGGLTRLRMAASWAGIDRPSQRISDLTAQTSAGRAIPIQVTSDHTWVLRHPADAELRVAWTLRPSGRQPVHHPDYYYRPIVESERFHLIGTTGLIFPEHLSTREPVPIRVRWRGFAEAGWKVACSHGDAQDELVVERTLDAFRHAVFVAGPFRLLRRDIRGGALVVAMTGDWSFSDEAFSDLTARIVAAERTFFDDFDYPFYLVSLIPIGRQVPGRIATGGTGLTDSVALFLGPGLSLAPGSRSRRRLVHLLAHELFHNWNGRKIDRKEPERLVYWFSEGFTDFYARRLLYRAGLVDLGDRVAQLNATSAQFHTNPYRGARNDKIEQAFWSDEKVRELPYQRGALVAHLVDDHIQKTTRGEKSLDDLVRALYRHAVATGERIDTPGLLSWIERDTSKAFAERVRRIVVDGAPIGLPADLHAPCLEGTTRQIGTYELGFDRERSLADRRVTGVVKGSAAWHAGLRDGQALAGWSIEHGRADKRVELVVREGDTRTPISYYPQRDPVPVPWYAVDRAEACPGRL